MWSTSAHLLPLSSDIMHHQHYRRNSCYQGQLHYYQTVFDIFFIFISIIFFSFFYHWWWNKDCHSMLTVLTLYTCNSCIAVLAQWLDYICRLRAHGRGTYQSASIWGLFIDLLSPCRPAGLVYLVTVILDQELIAYRYSSCCCCCGRHRRHRQQ